MTLPDTDQRASSRVGIVAAIAVVAACVLFLAFGVYGLWQFGQAGLANDRHDNVADWPQAASMARLFELEWPESTRSIHYSKDVWFHSAYEVRVDVNPADAAAFLDSIPDCEPVDEIPRGFIYADWWQVEDAVDWSGCETDPTAGWSNTVVVDRSSPEIARVYLAHFQPDS